MSAKASRSASITVKKRWCAYRCRVGVVAAGEVTVVGRDNRVSSALLDVAAIPLSAGC